MNQQSFFKARLYFTAGVTIAVWALLARDYYGDGIPSHHLLANKDLPAISNAWGGLLLPLLTWVLLYRVQKDAYRNGDAPRHLRHCLYGFSGALLFGAALSVFFTLGYPEVCGYMVLSLFPLALFFPIYQAGYLLGFVLGMTYTFGAILPAAFGALLCMAFFIVHRYIRRGLLFAGSRLAPFAPGRKINTKE